MNNVKSEFELYEPMRKWLHSYLKGKYKADNIITRDAHAERLDKVLRSEGISIDVAIGLDIQIDVLGIIQYRNTNKLFFIEAKKTNFSLHDLGQLWAYCKLIDPEEAFLFSSMGLGSLDKVMNILKREDLLNFGSDKKIKKMQIAKWNIAQGAPDMGTMIPKI